MFIGAPLHSFVRAATLRIHGSIFALCSLLDRQKVVAAKLHPRGARTALHGQR